MPFSHVILKFVVSHSHTPKPGSSREVITVTKSVYIPLELFCINFQHTSVSRENRQYSFVTCLFGINGVILHIPFYNLLFFLLRDNGVGEKFPCW